VRHGNAYVGRTKTIVTPAKEDVIIAAMERKLRYITRIETIPKYDPQSTV